jgi:hypothetical protein
VRCAKGLEDDRIWTRCGLTDDEPCLDAPAAEAEGCTDRAKPRSEVGGVEAEVLGEGRSVEVELEPVWPDGASEEEPAQRYRIHASQVIEEPLRGLARVCHVTQVRFRPETAGRDGSGDVIGDQARDHGLEGGGGKPPARRIRPPGDQKPLVLSLQYLQTLQLIPAHPATILAPAVAGLNRHTDLAHRIRNRLPLTLQHLNLPQLQNDVFGLVSFPSHPLVLLKSGSTYPG